MIVGECLYLLKVAVVAGGTGALGKEHSLPLAREGCGIILAGHRQLKKTEAVNEEIRAISRHYKGGRAAISIDILVDNTVLGIARAFTIVNMDKAD